MTCSRSNYRWNAALRFVALATPLFALAVACGDDDGGGPSGGGGLSDSVLALEPVVSGLDMPVFLTAPAGDPRLFIIEKDGRIRIFKNGALLATPFLDITGLTTKGTEQGLLGLAFAPDYANSGRFYVVYTAPGGGNGGNEIVARYQVSGNPDVANSASDTLIIFAHPETNHNGGNLVFGPDGFLYIGFGDGGTGGSTAQDGTTLLGHMLRIDVSGSDYTSPASNPFSASGTIRHEIWAMGLRNPWRWSFDRSTGDLYIADVGENNYEEVDVQPAGSAGGQNYGWPIMEGTHCLGGGSCNQTGLTLPVLTYDHSDGCAIAGGYVYRGSAVPAIQGHYFYSDNCSGFIRSFKWSGGTVSLQKEWDALNLGSVNSFGEDGNGELYVMTSGGALYRFAEPAP